MENNEMEYYAVVSIRELEEMLAAAKEDSRVSQIILGKGKGVRARSNHLLVLRAKLAGPKHPGQLRSFTYRGQ